MELELDFDPTAVCRICLSSTNKLLNIFSSSVVDGYLTAVPHMIAIALDIKVSTADGLPDKVCTVCKSDIVNFFTFKEKSKRTDTVLRTTLLRPETPPTASVVEAQNAEAVSVERNEKEDSAAVPPPAPIIREKTVTSRIKTEKPATAPLPRSPTPQPVAEEEENVLKDYQQEEPDTTDDVDVSVCEICEESFETLGALIDHCEATHEGLNSIERHNIKEEVIIDDDDVDDESICDDNPEEHFEAEEEEDQDGSEKTYVGEEYTEIDQLDDSGDEAGFLCHCGKSFSNNKKFQTHVKTDHLDDEMDVDSDHELIGNEFRCILCDITFKNSDQLVGHYNETHEHFCEECAVVYVSEDELLLHNVQAHKLQKPKPRKTTSRIPATSLPEFRCSHCDKSIRGQLKFEQHQKLHDAMNVINNFITFYPCQKCHLIFLTESEGNAHRTFHEENDEKPSNDQYVDASCTDYQFLDEDGYDDGSYSCGICSVMWPNAADAKFHLLSHSTLFTCPYDVCGCQYDNFGRYTSHIMNKHVNGQDHRCNHCNQQLNTFDELQAHMKLKCSERKFACNHCDKKFFSSKALRLHERVIKGKTFMCQFCGKSFAQQGELTIHNRTHTGERPFACTICGKQYKTSSMRTAHMDTHIPGKTFSCSFCDKKLQTRTSYRNHMKRHTENKKHECTYCGKMFFTKYHVKLHTMKVHERGKIPNGQAENAAERIQVTYVEQSN